MPQPDRPTRPLPPIPPELAEQLIPLDELNQPPATFAALAPNTGGILTPDAGPLADPAQAATGRHRHTAGSTTGPCTPVAAYTEPDPTDLAGRLAAAEHSRAYWQRATEQERSRLTYLTDERDWLRRIVERNALPTPPPVITTELASVSPEGDDLVVGERAELSGLFGKYRVQRVDGRAEPGARYFVLDYAHDWHARVALAAYIEVCRESKPDLARDLAAELDAMAEPAPEQPTETDRG